MFESPFETGEEQAQPPPKGVLTSSMGADPLRGMPVKSPIPASPLDFFSRRSIVAPAAAQGSAWQAPPPLEHPRILAQIQPIDTSQSNADYKIMQDALPGIAKLFGAKDESAEETLNKVKIATAKPPPEAKPEMPEVSSDRQDYYKNAGGFESGNDDKAVNPFYSPDKAAAGRFQFMPSTVASMRAQNPDLAKQIDANWRTDKRQQLILMNAYTDISDNLIRQITGKDPDNAQRFAMHLFGHGMGSKIIKSPTIPIEAMFPNEEAFKEAVRVNPGVITYGMTGNDFLKWAAPIFGRKHDK